ncbi:MAG: hypothetical protein NVS3B3_24000 [Aquirhabdus sp.]
MRLLLTPPAVKDLAYWQANDAQLASKIEQVLHKLKHGVPLHNHQMTALSLRLPDLFSVKVSSEHRIVFEQLRDDVIVHQCRFHY